MKRIDRKHWMLLIFVVPLCGNTCTFHSTSNDGDLFVAVCVPPSHDCPDLDTDSPDHDDDSDTDTETSSTRDGGNSRIASEQVMLRTPEIRTASSLERSDPPAVQSGPVEIDSGEASGEAVGEPVPALGPFAIAVLVSLVAISAFSMLRKRGPSR